MNISSDSELDQIDRMMLAHLVSDGRISVTELADKVGLSKTPCAIRLRRLRERGFIKKFSAILDPAMLDRDHVAFVEVKLADTRETALAAFNASVLDVAEIESCHMIAGAFDYLLKVRTRDVKSYRRILGEVISALPHVSSTSTHVSMEAVKDQAS